MKFSTRISYLIGEDKLQSLSHKHVAVFGVGGVGSFVCEALVRSGIEELSIIDFDIIDITNLNRQLMTSTHNIGKKKVDVLKDRLLAILPELKIHVYPLYFESKDQFDFSNIDYVVDAIDHVQSKIELLKTCDEFKIPFIMALGTARKLDPTKLCVSKLSKTSVDPLAKKMRLIARKEKLADCKVVFSTEEARPITRVEEDKLINGSMIFVPASAGILIAQQVIMDMLQPIK